MAAYMKLGDIKGQTAADAASDAFAFAPDAAEHKDHKNWINVASCNMGGHRSGDGEDATGAFAHDPATAQLYPQIELKEVMISSWQTGAAGAGGGKWIELNDFSFDGATGAGPSPTGHYTQMIWAETRAVLLGAGNDVFQWDPGDGSDTVEGQNGFADGFAGGVYVAAGDVSGAGYDALGRLLVATDAGTYNDAGTSFDLFI